MLKRVKKVSTFRGAVQNRKVIFWKSVVLCGQNSLKSVVLRGQNSLKSVVLRG